MLIVVALLAGVSISLVIIEVTRGLRDQAQLATSLGKSGLISNPQHPDPRELAHFRQQWHGAMKEIFPIALERVLIQLSIVALLTLLAIGIYRSHPQRKRLRRRLQVMRSDQAPTVTAYLRRCASNLGIPGLRIEHRPGYFLGGESYGLRGREALALNGTAEDLEREWGDTLKAIALHEIGHVVNGDAGDREKAKAFWGALLALLVLTGAGILFLWYRGEFSGSSGIAPGVPPRLAVFVGCVLLWSLAAQLLLFRMVRAGLIRSREFYADWRVANWGFGKALEKILPIFERQNRGRWRRLWTSHPSAGLRREVLRNPRGLFRFSYDLPFLTGVLFMCVWSNGYSLVLHLSALGMSATGILAGESPWATQAFPLTLELFAINTLPPFVLLSVSFLVISWLGTSVLGVQVQRVAVAELAGCRGLGWGYLRLLPSALLLAVGMEVGLLFAPISPLIVGYLMPIRLLGWFVGATLVMWLWLVYIRAATRLSIGVRLSDKRPELLQKTVLLSAAVLMAVLFWPLWMSRWVLSMQSSTLPVWLVGISGGRSAESYGYLSMQAVILCIAAVAIYLLFGWACLVLASIGLSTRHPACLNCAKTMNVGFAVGRFCDACGSSLTPWIYAKVQGDPGSADPKMAVSLVHLRPEPVRPGARRGSREVWAEIAGLALASGGLVVLTIAGLLFSIAVVHRMVS